MPFQGAGGTRSFAGAQGLTSGFQGMHKTPGVGSSLSGIGAAATEGCSLLSWRDSPNHLLQEKKGIYCRFGAGAKDSGHLGGLVGIEGRGCRSDEGKAGICSSLELPEEG